MQLKAIISTVALGAIMLSSAGAVIADEARLKGFGIRIENLDGQTTWHSEYAAQVPPVQTTTKSGTRSDFLNFLADGTLVAWPVSIPCKVNGTFTQLSILYKPASGDYSGDVTCDRDRTGTDLQWFDRSPIVVHFTSHARHVGDELQLDAKLEAKSTYDTYDNGAVAETSSHEETVQTIVQSAVLHIPSGRPCEIRKLTSRDETVANTRFKGVLRNGGTESDLPYLGTQTRVYAATARSSCKLM